MIQVTLMPELARLIHQFGSSQQVPTIKYVPFAQLFNWLKDSHCSLAPTFPASTDQGCYHFLVLLRLSPYPILPRSSCSTAGG